MSNKGKHNHLILLLFIALIEYIVFSSQISAVIALFAVPVICPVLYSLDSKKHRLGYLVFALAVSAISFYVSAGGDIFSYIFTFVQIHLSSYIICNCYLRKDSDFKETVAILTIANLACVIGDLAIIKYYHKIDIINTFVSAFDEYTKSAASLAGSAGIIEGLTQQDITDIFNAFKNGVVMLIPSLLIISSVLISFITVELTKLIFKAYLKYDNSRQNFRNFSIGVFLSLANVIFMLISYLCDSELIVGASYNFMVVSMFLYAANGFSVICNFIFKKIKSSFAVGAILILLIVILLASATVMGSFGGISIVFYLGILDSCFDFRKLKKK